MSEVGKIELDSSLGKKLGFTSDKFDGWLWRKGKDIYISFIVSLNEGQGNLSKLFDRILELGYNIKVPIPLGKMRLILTKKSFRRNWEYDKRFGKVEVWELTKNECG